MLRRQIRWKNGNKSFDEEAIFQNDIYSIHLNTVMHEWENRINNYMLKSTIIFIIADTNECYLF